MDILKQGCGVEVLQPKSLRNKVAQEIAKTAKIYKSVL